MKIDLAICAIVKNEAPYIKEWIEYHKMIGVQKFYIYDNESTDNLLSVLAPYIYRGLVEYTQIEGYGKQMTAYNECLEKCKERVKWLAYIDLDEFIVPVKGYNLTKVLEEYEEYPGIGINWVLYDFDRHIIKPKGGVIENYTSCNYDYNTPGNHHIKSIIRPDKTVKIVTPHHAIYEGNMFAVDENKNFIEGDFEGEADENVKCAFTKEVSVNKLRINHYWSKSYEEVLLKVNRGRAMLKAKRTLVESMYKYKECTYDFVMYKFAVKMYPRHIVQNTYRLLKSLILARRERKKYRVGNVKIVYDSSLFDEKWYRKTYSINKNEDCAYHYLKYGWKLGYNPSEKFNGNKYLEKYKDVKRVGMCPLLHYEKHGKKESRSILFKTYDDYKKMRYSEYPVYLKNWFKNLTGKDLNLDNPKTFNEKIQWMKLYDSTPIKTKLADKYLVREWVKEKIGEEYLIPLLGVYDKFEDIDFDKLPDRFVIKYNHGCGCNIIVKDKSKLDLNEVKRNLVFWKGLNYAFISGFELHYKNIKPKIIIEKFIENQRSEDLNDYKFYCFNGKVHSIQIISDRTPTSHKVSFYDKNWVKQEWYDGIFYEGDIDRPKNLDLMIELAENLSNGFNFVRVDLYYLDNEDIYFGEMTFTPASGSMKWSNDKIDKYLGSLIKLPKLAYNVDTGKYYNYKAKQYICGKLELFKKI